MRNRNCHSAGKSGRHRAMTRQFLTLRFREVVQTDAERGKLVKPSNGTSLIMRDDASRNAAFYVLSNESPKVAIESGNAAIEHEAVQC
jgi:hypothetical protein